LNRGKTDDLNIMVKTLYVVEWPENTGCVQVVQLVDINGNCP